MKRFLIVFYLLPLFTDAKTLTVDNSPGSSAHYSDLTVAYTAASNGDTLIIQPSFTTYSASGFTMQKRLFIYGPGYGQQYAPGKSAVISALKMENAAGSIIQGLYIIGLNINNTNRIIVKDCYLIGAGSGAIRLGPNSTTNISIKGCHLQGDYSQHAFEILNNVNVNDVFIENCLFYRNPGCNTALGYRNFGFVSGGNSTVNINHCVFFNVECSPCNSCSNSTAPFFHGGSNAVVENNIFYTNLKRFSRLDTLTGAGSVFRRNITFHPSDSLIALRDTGNLNNIDPRFTEIAATNGVPSGGTTDNYRLKSGSAGRNAATDATDIGIYGGVYEFSNRGYSSSLPIILEVTPLNRSVRQNGVIRVRVRATTENQ